MKMITMKIRYRLQGLKELQAIFFQGKRKVEAGYKPSNITETLVGHIECLQPQIILFQYFQLLQSPYLAF